MKVTSAYANKLIRGYREELAAIVSNERDTCTTTYQERRKTPCFSYGDIRRSETKFLLKG